MFSQYLNIGVLLGTWYMLVKDVDTFALSPEIVSRNEWHAQEPIMVENLTNPVPFVVIHHSYIPSACYTKDECITAMQSMQNFHQKEREWNDIGYSFAAGSDNRIYVGRGWTAVGAHAPKYNDKSIGIVLIGDWREQIPPEGQLTAVKQLIKMGVRLGYIDENYRLVGHRQVRDTECPGGALFKEIQTWPHWTTDVSFQDSTSSSTDENQIDVMKELMKPDPIDGGGSLLLVSALGDLSLIENNKSKRENLAT